MLGTCEETGGDRLHMKQSSLCINWRPVDIREPVGVTSTGKTVFLCLAGHEFTGLICPQCSRRASTEAPKSDTSAERKAAPLWSGCLNYFPLALLAVARLSKKANDKHNPGEPLHWSRKKSNDHLDCAARHLLNPEEIDPEFNEPHAVAAAWRALAVLQLIEENRLAKS